MPSSFLYPGAQVADLLTRGELADGARAGEHAAVQAEWDATHAADDAAKARAPRRPSDALWRCEWRVTSRGSS